MYKHTITLIQHSPLIHFQYDQAGATLRASEVKPRLDRYILENLKFSSPKRFNLYKEEIDLLSHAWNEKTKSPYHLNIVSDFDHRVFIFSYSSKWQENCIKNHEKAIEIGGNNFDIADKTPLFSNNHLIRFGRNGENHYIRNDSEWDKLKMGIWLDNIKVIVSGINVKMNQLVSECMPYIFATENFGLRQSKGFGCFSVKEHSSVIDIGLQNDPSISGIYRKPFRGDWKSGFKDILNFWKLLKSGDNHHDYYKSDLMKYFCMLNGIRWEKRIIKKKISQNFPMVWSEILPINNRNRISGCLKDTDEAEKIDASHESYKYIRGLLGLAQHYEFKTKRNDNFALVMLNNSDIKRFKSPITFKIIDSYIYIICHSIPPKLCEDNGAKRFYSFNLDSKINDEKCTGELENLEIPSGFQICSFLDSPFLGKNFENAGNWKKPESQSVAQYHGFEKIY